MILDRVVDCLCEIVQMDRVVEEKVFDSTIGEVTMVRSTSERDRATERATPGYRKRRDYNPSFILITFAFVFELN